MGYRWGLATLLSGPARSQHKLDAGLHGSSLYVCEIELCHQTCRVPLPTARTDMCNVCLAYCQCWCSTWSFTRLMNGLLTLRNLHSAGLRAYSTDGFDVGLARPGGQWEEPWDQKSALKTIEKLERHWYQLDGAAAAAAGPSPGAGEPTGESDDSCGSDDEGPPKKQLKATVNKVCVHVACSAQTVCLIEQLQIVRDNYRGRIDQFRIKVWPIDMHFAGAAGSIWWNFILFD